MLKKLKHLLALILCLLIVTTSAFADVILYPATFEIDGNNVTSISLSSRESKTLTVTLTGTGSIEGNMETDFFTYPTKITIGSSGSITVNTTGTENFIAGQTGFSFPLEVCAASDANFGSVSFDLFAGAPRMGSGGGTGTYISFGKAIKLRNGATTIINITHDGDNGDPDEFSDISVTKSASVTTADVGDEVTFTVSVINNGPDDSTGLVVSDLLPAGLGYASHVAGAGTYTPSTGEWDIGNLANDSTAVLTITAIAQAAAAGTTVTNTASVQSMDQIDTDSDNNSSFADVYITAVDIAVTKTLSSGLPNANNQVTFTIVAANNGPDAATGVVVTDTLPAGMTFVSSSPAADGSLVNVSGQTVSWNIGALASGGTATLLITARVTAAGNLVNTAAVTGSDQYDKNEENNSDTATIEVSELKIYKFYDGNINGVNDSTETELGDWMFKVEYDLDGEGSLYGWTYLCEIDSGASLFFPAGTTVRVTEGKSSVGRWVNTTDTVRTVALPNNFVSISCVVNPTNIEFGNVCLGAGGGKTLGFWSNKNGEKEVRCGNDLSFLAGLNLRDAAGKDFDPASHGALKKWLLNGDAVNMAYMLSVQLAAMELNVYNGFVEDDSMVYAPALDCANALGFVSIGALMDCANSMLAADGCVGSDSALRAEFEAVKNALDAANNNLNFVQTAPCKNYGGFTF